MPAKSIATLNQKLSSPSAHELEAIKSYFAQKPDFDKLIAEGEANPQRPQEHDYSEYERSLNEAVKISIEEAKKEAAAKQTPIV